MVDVLKTPPDELKKMIAHGDLTICVVGLGWMGLPLAALFADAGAKVIGVDINPRVVEKTNKGSSHVDEPGLDSLLRKHTRSGGFKATDNLEEGASQSDMIFLVVPTLTDKTSKPDYSAVEASSKNIGKGIKKGSLVVFQSTAAPGVTERIVRAAIEKSSGLKCGDDFGLAYSPIRAMSGRALADLRSYARIVSGVDKSSLETASAALSCITKGDIIHARDIKTAEASKLFEAIYRDVNIALANEFASFCEAAGIDYMEARAAANTQPYSYLHVPGVGVGGHCLPVYPYLLADEAETLGVRMKLLFEARRTNEEMPKHVLGLISAALRASGKSLGRAKIAILGIAFRPNIKELRYSPSRELVALLKKRRAKVVVFDPRFNQKEISQLGYETEPTLKRAIGKSDCVVLAVGHDEFKKLDPRGIVSMMNKQPAIVDCTHILDPSQVEKTGAIYRGVGRGLWSK